MSNKIVEKLTTMISTQMYVSQNFDIKTKSMEAKFVKNNVSLMSSIKKIQDIEINFSSFCDLLLTSYTSGSSCNNNQIITEKVKLLISLLFRNSKFSILNFFFQRP
jgi:hypothetical protein